MQSKNKAENAIKQRNAVIRYARCMVNYWHHKVIIGRPRVSSWQVMWPCVAVMDVELAVNPSVWYPRGVELNETLGKVGSGGNDGNNTDIIS